MARLSIPGTVAAVPVAALFFLAAYGHGYFYGHTQAVGKSVYDVLRRDSSEAVVIFTHRDEIIERSLDVSAGPDGRPRNVWLPGVVVRPMPDNGITYQTVRLGRTQPSKPVGP